MTTININAINSAEIRYEAQQSGLSTVSFIGEFWHPDRPGSSDWMIRIYNVNGVRVADTNGNPVWEEDDRSAFAALLEEYGVDI